MVAVAAVAARFRRAVGTYRRHRCELMGISVPRLQRKIIPRDVSRSASQIGDALGKMLRGK